MIPSFQSSGRLPPGVHEADWGEITERLGFTPARRRLLQGLEDALILLRHAGCRLVYLDGSFATSKAKPGDIDVCWASQHVDFDRLDPVFLSFANGRAAQKKRFLCEFFPAELPEGASGKFFLDFFQIDKQTGRPKGIVALHLRNWRK